MHTKIAKSILASTNDLDQLARGHSSAHGAYPGVPTIHLRQRLMQLLPGARGHAESPTAVECMTSLGPRHAHAQRDDWRHRPTRSDRAPHPVAIRCAAHALPLPRHPMHAFRLPLRQSHAQASNTPPHLTSSHPLPLSTRRSLSNNPDTPVASPARAQWGGRTPHINTAIRAHDDNVRRVFPLLGRGARFGCHANELAD